MLKMAEQNELEKKTLEQKKIIEEGFCINGFNADEIDEIIQAKENGRNFPFSDEKWYALSTLYRGYYWDYVNWVKSGKKNAEPTISKILEKDPELLEFEKLEAACNEAAEGDETKEDGNMEKVRPISIVAPLPTHFSKIPKLKRSDSTLSTDSNTSLESNSSKVSSCSKLNVRSSVDNHIGTNNYTQNFFPIWNKKEFLPREPNKNQPAKVDSTPTTPVLKRKENINFIKKNRAQAGSLFRKNNLGVEGDEKHTIINNKIKKRS